MNRRRIDALILFIRNAIENGRNIPQVSAALSRYGYDLEALEGALRRLEHLEKLHADQKREFGEQVAATQALASARRALRKLYNRHLKLARAVLDAPDAIRALDLAGTRKVALPDWLEQVRIFYDNALKMPDVKDELSKVTLTDEVLQDGQEKVKQLSVLRSAQLKESGEAQSATEARDLVLEEMRKWVKRFVPIAQVALEDNPQMLEALGIKTPKSGSSTYGDEDEDEEDEEVDGLEQT